MNSSECFNLLPILGLEPSRNAKRDLLREFLYDDFFRKVVLYTYDSFRSYYLVKMPETRSGTGEFNDWTFGILDALNSRKLSGDSAKNAVKEELERLNIESAKLLRLILSRDLAVGVNVKTINAAWPGLIKVFPYMRCSLLGDVHLNSLEWKLGVFSQVKADGMFVNITLLPTGNFVHTRVGKAFDLDLLPTLQNDFKRYGQEGSQYHGELLVVRDGEYLKREIGNGILNSVLQGTKLPSKYSVQVLLWDMVANQYIKEKGKCYAPYSQRYSKLDALFKDSPIKLIPTKRVYSFDDAYDHFLEVTANGGEGTIIKDPNAIWQDGTSRAQIKLKTEKELDLRIVDFIEGSGKNADTFGSLLCTSEDGLIEVGVTGLSDELRNDIWMHQDDWLGSIIAVKYNAVISNRLKPGAYSLYLPRFVERRFDKIKADNYSKNL